MENTSVPERLPKSVDSKPDDSVDGDILDFHCSPEEWVSIQYFLLFPLQKRACHGYDHTYNNKVTNRDKIAVKRRLNL